MAAGRPGSAWKSTSAPSAHHGTDRANTNKRNGSGDYGPNRSGLPPAAGNALHISGSGQGLSSVAVGRSPPAETWRHRVACLPYDRPGYAHRSKNDEPTVADACDCRPCRTGGAEMVIFRNDREHGASDHHDGIGLSRGSPCPPRGSCPPTAVRLTWARAPSSLLAARTPAMK